MWAWSTPEAEQRNRNEGVASVRSGEGRAESKDNPLDLLKGFRVMKTWQSDVPYLPSMACRYVM